MVRGEGGEVTHLDSEDDLTAVARVLALHWPELTDCLVTQSGALKGGHCASLGPEENRGNVKNKLYLQMRAEIFVQICHCVLRPLQR